MSSSHPDHLPAAAPAAGPRAGVLRGHAPRSGWAAVRTGVGGHTSHRILPSSAPRCTACRLSVAGEGRRSLSGPGPGPESSRPPADRDRMSAVSASRDGWFGGGRPPSVTAHCRCARRQYRAAEREGLVGVVRIGTWNLESLFRPGGAAGPRTDAAYQAKLAALAAVINVMAPDLLAVQEVGDPAALVDLAELAEGGWQCPTADP